MHSFRLTFVGMALALLLAMFAVPLLQSASPPPYTRLISRNTGGTVGNENSSIPSVTADGRYVVFQSAASDLVSGDTNGRTDVFMYDRMLQTMARVSVATGGAQADNNSGNAVIAPAGRYIVFESDATDLVSNDTNGLKDIFLHDLQTSQTTRVNVGPGGIQATGGNSTSPHLSDNGAKIVYVSGATNLVATDGNIFQDIFLYTTATGITTRISIAAPPEPEPSDGNSFSPYITPNGQIVAFASAASNLVPVDNNGFCGAFSCGDIFIRDLNAGTTTLVSLRSDGGQGNNNSAAPSLSSDSRWLVWESDASNLDTVLSDTNFVRDIFLRDLTTSQTRRISIGAGNVQGFAFSNQARISQDGNWVVFTTASEFVAEDLNGYDDVYRYSRLANTIEVASLPEGGGESNESSNSPDISGDGQRVVFTSFATNLAGSDTNNANDVFVRTYLEDDATPTPTVTPAATGSPTPTPTATPSNTPPPNTTPTSTQTPSPTNTPGNGPPTMTPTGSPATSTPSGSLTATATATPSGPPRVFLPLIRRRP